MKNIIFWGVIIAILTFTFRNYLPVQKDQLSELTYSQFISEVKSGNIAQVQISNRDIQGKFINGNQFKTYSPESDNRSMIGELLDNKVDVIGVPPEKPSILMQLLLNSIPVILWIAIWIYFMRQMSGGGGGKGGMFSFGKSRAKMLNHEKISITFNDVAGIDEAKAELSEIVDFLKNPKKFQTLGGKIPKGVLLVGHPGTGKTLLAKAISGEAKVPFFSISGSDFVEMFVGIGASRVRDMFEQAKKVSPCIIFIDEIDAVGRHRGSGLGGGHDEREQTLNQLLVEMDGFEEHFGLIVIAATNRPDVLDPALLRPGRFDRQVVVPLPDIKGREQILNVHVKKLKKSNTVSTKIIARGTPGFSGADLANLVNEAALIAARENKPHVEMKDLEKAKDKIMMGVERKSMVMTDEQKKLIAYHEAGHAIVGLQVPDHDPVYKVSIIPRGRALGITMFLPEDDRLSVSKRRLESQISSLFGGRIAEELIFGKECVTTGAQNDIERATEIARNMVTKWGLSSLGPLAFSEEQGEMYLGYSKSQPKLNSDATANQIDNEIKLIIDTNYKRAKGIVEKHIDILNEMAQALIQYETIDQSQIHEIMEGKKPTPPQSWDDDNTNQKSSGSQSNTIQDTITQSP
ncbi:MAG: ATP-dependent zinc metalloprotease FtsH [Methylacidiphilales bacterium]|nr:ATP-dependent zinc metalloprotease FtsH [Candidatus Methylacidiphilales bacterium]